MFGYVKPLPAEMKVKEYTTYKAFYCGLCRCTGKCLNCAARFTLSYDFVFLAVLRCAVSGEKIEFAEGRCMAHMIKKRPYAKPTEQIEYSARAGVLLTYHKLRDDISDEKGIKKFTKKLLLPHMERLRKKSGLPALDEITKEKLDALSVLEKEKCPSADAAAEIFGTLLGEYGAYGFEGEKKRVAYEICFRVGKWIYFADALDDYESDKKSGAYNPLVLSCKTRNEAAQIMNFSLKREIAAARAAAELIENDRGLVPILDNILGYGLPAQITKITNTPEK